MITSLTKKSGGDKKSSMTYLFSVLLAVAFTWLLHEFAHWLASSFLGYETVLTLNSTYPVTGKHHEAWHTLLISAVGPLVTILQALAVFGHLLYRGWFKYFYPFLFVPFYMRLLAAFMNSINLNDEGRISSALNFGTYTLPLMVSAGLFWMVYVVSKRYSPGRKFQAITLLLTMLISSVLILADQFWSIQLL